MPDRVKNRVNNRQMNIFPDGINDPLLLNKFFSYTISLSDELFHKELFFI